MNFNYTEIMEITLMKLKIIENNIPYKYSFQQFIPSLRPLWDFVVAKEFMLEIVFIQ